MGNKNKEWLLHFSIEIQTEILHFSIQNQISKLHFSIENGGLKLTLFNRN